MCVLISFFNFFFYTGVQPVNNAVIVPGAEQRDSAIHAHVSILPQTPLPSRLPRNIKQSSLCYTKGPCWLSVLNIAVRVHGDSKLPNYPSSLSFLTPSPGNHKFVL